MHEDILTADDGITKAEALLVIPVLHGALGFVCGAPTPCWTTATTATATATAIAAAAAAAVCAGGTATVAASRCTITGSRSNRDIGYGRAV